MHLILLSGIPANKLRFIVALFVLVFLTGGIHAQRVRPVVPALDEEVEEAIEGIDDEEAYDEEAGDAPDAPAAEVSFEAGDEQASVHRVVPPVAFSAAVNRGTRTPDGEPGSGYWQQYGTYRLNARVDPSERTLKGSGHFVYQNQSPDTLHQVHLELVQNFHRPEASRNESAEVTTGISLQRVVIDGRDLKTGIAMGARYAVVGTQLIVTPAHPIMPGTKLEMDIEWSFPIPAVGAAGRMGHSRDNLFFLAYWFPVFAVYDDVEGWHSDQFLGLSEFYRDFADFDVAIQVPEQWLVAATGTLSNASEVLDDGVLQRLERARNSDEIVQIVRPQDFGNATQEGKNGWLTWRFEADNVRDFAFSVMRESVWDFGRVSVGDRDDDGSEDFVSLNSFYREAATRWTEATRYQQHALRFMSHFSGVPYPWDQLTAVEGADIIGGGMEYPMMMLLGDYNIAGDEALYDVIAHETAHMWIPMIVSTDERRFAWMDEGTTSFAENNARMDFYPNAEPELNDMALYTHAASNWTEGEIMRWSDFHYSDTGYMTASYPKPSMLLATLRVLLSEEVFNEAYQTFLSEWAYKHPYPWDLFNTFERVSGEDLDWFWDSWYYRTWTLDQGIKSVTRKGKTTEIVVENVGKVPMPVFLTITFSDGNKQEEEIPVEEWLEGARTAVLRVTSDRRVDAVEIDPELGFPDIDRSNNLWSR